MAKSMAKITVSFWICLVVVILDFMSYSQALQFSFNTTHFPPTQGRYLNVRVETNLEGLDVKLIVFFVDTGGNKYFHSYKGNPVEPNENIIVENAALNNDVYTFDMHITRCPAQDSVIPLAVLVLDTSSERHIKKADITVDDVEGNYADICGTRLGPNASPLVNIKGFYPRSKVSLNYSYIEHNSTIFDETSCLFESSYTLQAQKNITNGTLIVEREGALTYSCAFSVVTSGDSTKMSGLKTIHILIGMPIIVIVLVIIVVVWKRCREPARVPRRKNATQVNEDKEQQEESQSNEDSLLKENIPLKDKKNGNATQPLAMKSSINEIV